MLKSEVLYKMFVSLKKRDYKTCKFYSLDETIVIPSNQPFSECFKLQFHAVYARI